MKLPLVIALGCALGACRRTEPPAFGAGFLWGTAMSGFQVEMGCPTLPPDACEDRASDWYSFITSDEPSVRGLLSADGPLSGPGSWELYESDFDRAATELGNNALRLSIEWSRVFPSPTDEFDGHEALRAIANTDAIRRYRALFQAMRARGLEPLVTLSHYTLPVWLHDAVACHKDLDRCGRRGWLDKERVVREISKYARFVAKELGTEVDLWATLNEPMAVVVPGYLMPSTDRVNPPALAFRFAEAKRAMEAMVEAHARMYDAVKAADTADADGDGALSQVGLVFNFTPTAPKDPENKRDIRAAEDVFYLYNLAFLNAVTKGDLDHDLDGVAEHRSDLSGRMDYLGVNYYTRVTVEGLDGPAFPEFSPKTRFNPLTLNIWEAYPRGLYDMVMLANRLGAPAIVTENGTPDPLDDGRGSDFLVRHVTWLERALDHGADVRGYFVWSLIDNFEWNQGMGHFGLYAISKDDPAKRRVARQSVATYAEIVRAHGVPPALLERYPEAR